MNPYFTRSFAAVTVFASWVGCDRAHDDPTENAARESDSAADTSDVDVGNAGAIDCSADDECWERARGVLAALEPATAPPPYVASMCVRATTSADACQGFSYGGDEGDPACLCISDANRGSGDLIARPWPGCLVPGKAGTCLFTPDMFTGCSLEEPGTSCDPLCEDLDALRSADAESSPATEVRWAACGSGGCESVLRVGDACFTESSLPRLQAFDCALDDATIVDRARTASSEVCESDAPPAHAMYCDRDPNEWQGNPVDTSDPQICEASANCGLALACIDGACTCCSSDDQCTTGEACALDHCLLEDLVECRSYTDCPEGQLCVLSGLTGGTPRANEDMRAYCQSSSGGSTMP